MKPRLNQALLGINKQLQHLESLIASRPAVTILVPEHGSRRLEVQKYTPQNSFFPQPDDLSDGFNRRVEAQGPNSRRTFLPFIWGLSKLASSLAGTKASAGFNLGRTKHRPVYTQVDWNQRPVMISSDAEGSSPVVQISPIPGSSPGFQIQGTSPGMQVNQIPNKIEIQGSSPGFQIQSNSPGMQIRPVDFGIQGSSPGFQIQGSSPGVQVRPVNFGIQGSSPGFNTKPVQAQAELQFQLPSLPSISPLLSANLDFSGLSLRTLSDERKGGKGLREGTTQMSVSTNIGGNDDNTTRKTMLKHRHDHMHNTNMNFNEITAGSNNGFPINQNRPPPSSSPIYPPRMPDPNNMPPRPQYNQPPMDPYNQPPMDPYNQPSRDPYNQPPNPYNQPPRNPYNQPPRNPYNSPHRNPNMPPRGDGNPNNGGSYNQNVNIDSSDDSGPGPSRPRQPPKRYRPGQDDGGIIDMGGMPYGQGMGRDRNRPLNYGEGSQNSNTNINFSKRRSAEGLDDEAKKDHFEIDELSGH